MNCKLNDLAIIVQSEHRENIGRIIQIDAPYEPAFDGAFRWSVHAVGAPLIGYDAWVDRVIETLVGAIEDYMLRPISGIPMNDEVTDDLEVPVV